MLVPTLHVSKISVPHISSKRQMNIINLPNQYKIYYKYIYYLIRLLLIDEDLEKIGAILFFHPRLRENQQIGQITSVGASIGGCHD